MNYLIGDVEDGARFCTMLLMFSGRNLTTIGETIGGFETFLKRKNKTISELSDERLSELFKNYCEQTSQCSDNNIFAKG